MSLQSVSEKPLAEFMAFYKCLHKQKRPVAKPIVIPPAKVAKPPRKIVVDLNLTLTPMDSVNVKKVGIVGMRGVVIEAFGCTLQDFISASRDRRLVRARQCFFWLCKCHTTLSYPRMSALAGRKDHSVSIHGVKQFERLKNDFARELNFIGERLV